jgi:hypothetical protein
MDEEPSLILGRRGGGRREGRRGGRRGKDEWKNSTQPNDPNDHKKRKIRDSSEIQELRLWILQRKKH